MTIFDVIFAGLILAAVHLLVSKGVFGDGGKGRTFDRPPDREQSGRDLRERFRSVFSLFDRDDDNRS